MHKAKGTFDLSLSPGDVSGDWQKPPIFLIKRNRAKCLTTEQRFLPALPEFFFSHVRQEKPLYLEGY